MLLASGRAGVVRRVGLHGPLALYEGYPNIEQACDDSKAAVQTIVLFTRSAAHGASERVRAAATPNHVLLLHHAPAPQFPPALLPSAFS